MNLANIAFLGAATQGVAASLLGLGSLLDDARAWAAETIDMDEPSPPPDFSLAFGVAESGNYGNRFAGETDADGVITASFENTGGDAALTLRGFDIDSTTEVRVLLNGEELGHLSPGPENALNSGDRFVIDEAGQLPGINTLTFEQTLDITKRWGVTDIRVGELPGDPPSAIFEDGELDIMIIGDSFSIPERGFPSAIENALEVRGFGEVETIIDFERNDGSTGLLTQGGRQTAQGRDAVIEYFDDPANEVPELAILALGINDVLQSVAFDDVENRLDRTIDTLQANGVEVLLAAPEAFYPFRPEGTGITDVGQQRAFAAIYEQLAEDNDVVLAVDFIDGVPENLDLLEPDGFHPNFDGVDRMVENILPELEVTIQRVVDELQSLAVETVVA